MSEASTVDFDFVRDLVYRESAIAIEPDMKYLVESRLTSMIRKTEYSAIGDLVSALRRKNDPELASRVVDAMTTNETSFFRDLHPFGTLCSDVLRSGYGAQPVPRGRRPTPSPWPYPNTVRSCCREFLFWAPTFLQR